MKIKTLKFLLPIFSSVLIMVTVLIVLILVPKKEDSNEVKPHQYTEGLVIDKRIVEGYAGMYYYYPTEYQIVGKYYINNQEYTYTHYVSAEIYNSYNINDKIKFCITHEKIKEYE